jgi:hypothetical protein
LSESYEELDFRQAADLVKQRQRFTRRPRKSAEIVAQLMARKGYAQQSTTNELQETWKKVAPTACCDQTQAGQIRRGVLEVLVANSVLHHRLEFEKTTLLSELQKQLPNAKIRDIRFRIGNV